MSMIDKKGKIFGKLNIIDLIAILLIVAVLALIGYKLLVRSPGGLAGEGQAVVYTVEVKGVEPEVYEFIQKQLPSQLMAANELLDIEGIRASFVLTVYQGRIYVSARSIDEVNVQIIMERLGGGGHMNASGAQFDHTNMEEAVNCVKAQIDRMIEEGDI